MATGVSGVAQKQPIRDDLAAVTEAAKAELDRAIALSVSNRFQFRPPFRIQSRPLFGRCLELIHVMHRRDPRP